ncbi:MAG TPA: DNA polymerase IV [Candidatus Polarisedimenticolaceae bacterium]|nr:DNA polymerase IV [Candidatus Polarisedimenticolaceae bacterium]
MSRGGPQRVILHLDMDAFYAAIEIRENPALAGQPLIIGYRGRRGVVSTCSYEARRYGVRSAMPSLRAERLCPNAIWLNGRMALYVEVSRAIRSLMHEVSPVVEPLSIDEAFIDLSGIAADLAGGVEIARSLKRRIAETQRLTASAGVASNKFLAKLASDIDKPDALTRIAIDDLERVVWPLAVDRLWGVGPKTAARLRAAGIETIGDLLRSEPARLESVVSEAMAEQLRALARGEDDRRVVSDRSHKTISEERTYGRDLLDADAIDRALLARSEGVARQLRRERMIAHTVRLKVRAGDFTTWTRSRTLPAPTDLTEEIVRAARELFRERVALGGRGVRLLGVGVGNLEPAERYQSGLFDDPAAERARRMARVTDAVCARLGERAMTRARLLPRRAPTDDGEASSLPTVD